jgi:alkylation response protein AidB-like acyl-CoA dehydrogenase
MAMAKLKATEVLALIADEAIQIHGGMGLMDDLPLERIWRDARVERIWEGTSEIQRHIISREMLRALGAGTQCHRTMPKRWDLPGRSGRSTRPEPRSAG